MDKIENFGILTSISWNSNDWADDLTESDINASQYSYVQREGYAHESLNFGHELYPLEEEDKFIAYTPKFINLPSQENSKNVDIIIFISTDYHNNNKKKIIGCYGFPEIGNFPRQARHRKYRTYTGGNIRSHIDNIIYFKNKIIIDNDIALEKNLLPQKKEISNQGFNYLNSDNVFEILSLVQIKNKNNNKLEQLIKNLKKIKNSTKKSIKEIYESNSIIKDLTANSVSDIIKLEEKMKNATPETKDRISQYIERGSIAEKVKKLTGYKCLICEELGCSPYTFKKKNGDYYIETHHVEPVSNKKRGSLSISNLITVCPNHHRQLHYGNSSVINNTDKLFSFDVDGKKINIKKIEL